MSTSALHDIENKALTLAEGDRATLALHLIESLDNTVDADVEAAWLIEAGIVISSLSKPMRFLT